jgi:hypothetical protein
MPHARTLMTSMPTLFSSTFLQGQSYVALDFEDGVLFVTYRYILLPILLLFLLWLLSDWCLLLFVVVIIIIVVMVVGLDLLMLRYKKACW